MENKNGFVVCGKCGGLVEIEEMADDSWWVDGTILIRAKCADCDRKWKKIVGSDEFDGYEED